MKKVILFATLILGSVALIGSPTGLTWSCVDGTQSNGNCSPGRVTFSGTGYPAQVHVNVTKNSGGTVYDDFDYDATASFNFTETLYPAATYTVTVTFSGGSTVQQIITTGTSYSRGDD